MNSVTETEATLEGTSSWEWELLIIKGSAFTSTPDPISLLIRVFRRIEGCPPVILYLLFFGDEMSMYWGSADLIVPRDWVFFGAWWAGGAELTIFCRMEGRICPEREVCSRNGDRGSKVSKVGWGRILVGLDLSSLRGIVIVLWKGTPSGIRVPRSHNPFIFSLSATLRNDCKESCVMFT